MGFVLVISSPLSTNKDCVYNKKISTYIYEFKNLSYKNLMYFSLKFWNVCDIYLFEMQT